MTNLNIKIFGTANLTQMQAEFGKLETQIAQINAQMMAQVNQMGKVDPSGYARVNRELQRSSQIYRQALASTGMFHVEQLRVNSATSTYTELLQKQKLSLTQLWKQRKIGNAALKEQLALQQMVVRTNMDSFRGKQVIDVSFPSEVNEQLRTFGNRLGWIREQARSAGQQMVNWGKNTQWAGRQLMVGFTMPVAAAGAGMAVLAYQADQQLTRIAKVYDTYATSQLGKEREIADLRASSLQMAQNAATEYGASLKDTLQVEAELAATGKSGQELRKSTLETVRIATLGELDYGDAINTTIALQNAFKMSSDELTDTFNFMNAVENQTSLSIQDIAEATPRAASAMAALGVTAKEMTVMLVAMKERGVDAAEGANALKSATTRILSPVKQASEYFAMFGVNINKMSTDSKGNLFEFLQMLSKATQGMTDLQKQRGIAKLFGTYQYNRLNAALQGITDGIFHMGDASSQTAEAMKVLNMSAADTAAIAQQELDRQAESASGRFKRALESIKVQLAEMGQPFLEAATGILGVIEKIIKWFNRLPDGVKNFAMWGALVFALVGPLTMLLGLTANLAGNMIKLAVTATSLATKFNLITKEQQAARLAAKLAEAGFVSETRALQNLTIELEKYSQAQQAAHSRALGSPLTTAGAGAQPGKSGTMTAGGLWIPQNVAAAQQANAHASEEAAKASERQHGFMKGVAVAGGIFAASMITSMVSSNETVDNIANMAMYAALIGPPLVEAAIALKSVKWAEIASAIGTRAKGGIASATGAAGGLISSFRGAGGAAGKLSFAVKGIAGGIVGMLGPVGLLIAAFTAGAVAWKLIKNSMDGAAKNVREMTDNSEALGKIVGFDPKEAGALEATSKKTSEVQKRVAAMRDEFGGVIEKIKAATTEQDKFNTAMAYIGTDVIDKGGTIEQAQDAVKLALQAAGQTASEAEAIVIKFKGQFDAQGVRDQAVHAAEMFTKNAQDTLNKKGFWEDTFSKNQSISNEAEEWGKQAGEKIVLGVHTSMDNGLGQGAMLTSLDKLLEPLQKKQEEMAKAQRDRAAAGGGVDMALSAEQERTAKLIATINRKIITDLAGKKAAEQYSDAQLALMTSQQVLTAATVELTQADMAQRDAAYLSGLEAKNKRGEELTLAEAQALSAKTARDSAAAMDKQSAAIKNTGGAAKESKNDLMSLIDTFKTAEEGWQAVGEATVSGMKGALQEYADQAQSNFDDRMNAAMDKFKAGQDARMDALKNAQEKQNRALDASQDAANRRLEKSQQAAQDRLEARQDAEAKALEKRQDARRKIIEGYYDSQTDRINKAIEAEQHAEDIRQQIFQAEQTRIQRMAEMANRNIDFNAALASGNMDEAAKIMNDATASEQSNAMQDAETSSQNASDARVSALQAQLDAIDKAKQARLDALKITEDAETESLKKRQDAQKKALQNEQQMQKDALARKLQAEKDNLAARQKIEQASLQKRLDANLAAEKKIWDGRKAQLDRAIKDFQAFAPRNAAELAKHIKDISAKYDAFRVQTRGKFNGTAADVRSTLSRNIQYAMNDLVANQKWASIGQNIASQMIKGSFNMNMTQFIQWVSTGETPKNWKPYAAPKSGALSGVLNSAKVRKESRHSGGIVGSGLGSRAGISGSIKPSEKEIIAQKGEMVVNKKATQKNMGLLHAINSGAELGSKSEGRGAGYNLGLPGLMMAGTAAAAISALAGGIAAAGNRAMARDNSMAGYFTAGPAGKYGGTKFDATQLANAAIIASVGSSMGMSLRDIEIGIMTAITESMLRNLSGGDRDSVGLFQQRPSQGWGTAAQIHNPQYAARKFFEALKGVGNRTGLAPWMAAQKVQRSFDSTGSNYHQYWDEAMAIFTSLVRGGGMDQDTAGGGPSNRTGQKAIDWATARLGDSGWLALCQKFVRMSLGAGPGFPSAIAAWQGAKYKHGINNPNNVPAGVPVYWGGGKFGHVALSTGRGAVISTDFPTMGKIGRGTINSISSQWHKPLLGWTEDINGKRIYGLPGLKTGGFAMSDGLANLHGRRNAPEAVLSAPLTKDFKEGVRNFADGGPTIYNLNVDARGVTTDTVDALTKKVMVELKRMEARKPQSRSGR